MRRGTRANPSEPKGQGSHNRDQEREAEHEEEMHTDSDDPSYIEGEEEYEEVSDSEPENVPEERNPVVGPMDQFLDLLRQNLNQQPQGTNTSVANAFRAFKSLKPPEFQGSADPVEARAWLKEMEKSFEILSIEEAQKTVFATYLLKGEANFWWESKRNLETSPIVTWERFTTLFLEKYFPKYMAGRMELKFLNLKQENMSVAEYEAKFTELSRFVPKYVSTDEERAARFEQGLKPWIQNRVNILQLTNYAQLVQKATIAEAGSELSQKAREGKKRKSESHGEGHSSRTFQKRFNRGI